MVKRFNEEEVQVLETPACDVVIEPSALNRVLDSSEASEQLGSVLADTLSKRSDRLLIPLHGILEMFSSSDLKLNADKADRLIALIDRIGSTVGFVRWLPELLEIETRQNIRSTPLLEGRESDIFRNQLRRIAKRDSALCESMREHVARLKANLLREDLRIRAVVRVALESHEPISPNLVPWNVSWNLSDLRIWQIVLGLTRSQFGNSSETIFTQRPAHRIFFAWSGLIAANALMVEAHLIDFHRNNSYDDVLASAAAYSRVLITNDTDVQQRRSPGEC